MSAHAQHVPQVDVQQFDVNFQSAYMVALEAGNAAYEAFTSAIDDLGLTVEDGNGQTAAECKVLLSKFKKYEELLGRSDEAGAKKDAIVIELLQRTSRRPLQQLEGSRGVDLKANQPESRVDAWPDCVFDPMEAYLQTGKNAIEDVCSASVQATQPEILAGYMAGCATIHAAELIAKALNGLAYEIRQQTASQQK